MITFDGGFKLELLDELATQAFASSLAQVLEPGMVLYLRGELGAGKTTLVRALLKELGHIGAIKSPTFTLVESYDLPSFVLYHFDLYRLSDPTELDFIGIRDYLTGTGICIFEWADKGLGYIPAADIEIALDFYGNGRLLELIACSDMGSAALKRMTVGQG